MTSLVALPMTGAGAVGTQPSSVSLTADAVTIVEGQLVTFTANVDGSSGAPTGTVHFANQVSQEGYCSAPVESGTASCAANVITSTAPDTIEIDAFYGGDTTYASSTSPATGITVNAAQAYITLTADPNPARSNSTVNFGATLNVVAPGTLPASTRWTFTENGQPFFYQGAPICQDAEFPGDSSMGDCSVSFEPGTYDVVATVTSDVPLVVGPSNTVVEDVGDFEIPTSMSISVSPDPAKVGQAVSYTAEVTASPAHVTGTVSFSIGSTQLCNAAVMNIGGCIASNAPPGQDTVTARFSDNQDNNGYGPCQAATSLTVGAPPPPPFSGMASIPDGKGYWLVDTQGGVSPHGSALSYGSLLGTHLAAPISHIVSTPDGKGYWMVAADGGVFTFGDAAFFGSMGGKPLDAPVVDLAPTIDGGGYWLVGSDGGVFAFGDARFEGSMGGRPLNRPIVGITSDTATGGYWMVATDGGIFAFHAPFFGSTGAIHLSQPVNGMAPTADGRGYWFVASDGGIFAYGDAAFHGSTGAMALSAPIVGMAPNWSSGSYWLVGADGGVFSFAEPFYGSD